MFHNNTLLNISSTILQNCEETLVGTENPGETGKVVYVKGRKERNRMERTGNEKFINLAMKENVTKQNTRERQLTRAVYTY